jgi:RimJ/RimL family protein N-acetyltransferase
MADAESFLDLSNELARETWGADSPDRFNLEETRKLLRRVADESLPQVFAIHDESVIGSCGIIPRTARGASHVGYLGMGVRMAWRRQGLGRRLLLECILLARSAGLEKVELEVVSENAAAIRLYASVGFVSEGLKARARKVGDRYQDLQLMALWL